MKYSFYHLLFLTVIILGFSACDDDDEATVPNANIVNGVDTTRISAAYDFAPNFANVRGSRMHYVDVAGSGDETFVLIHGQPTSSYLWRNIVPHLAARGRVIAPDMIGMGKSDQPDIDYTLTDQIAYMNDFINGLNLDNITLVVHDWGGPLGFNYANTFPTKVKGVVFFETLVAPVAPEDVLPEFAGVLEVAFTGEQGDTMLGTGWRSNAIDNDFIELVIPNGVVRTLLPEEMDAYRAPYPTVASRKPVWQWPRQVPIPGVGPDENVAIIQDYFENYLTQSTVPKLFLYATPGFFGNAEVGDLFENIFPNTTSQGVGSGNHFIQEDSPHRIGLAINQWVDRVY